MKASRALRGLLRLFMILMCALSAGYVLRDEPMAAFLSAASGVAFFVLSEWRAIGP